MRNNLTLIGFMPPQTAPAQLAAMAGVAGPRLHHLAQGGVVVAAQAGAPRPATRGLDARTVRGLAILQSRLEKAALAGPFLPADPTASACALADLPALLDQEEPAIAALIATHGRLRQWDVLMRWTPESVLRPARASLALSADSPASLAAAIRDTLATARAAREAALHAALRPACRALRALPGDDCVAGFTVLVDEDGEALVTAALGTLPAELTEGAEADLRGPMPAVSFAAVRLATSAPAEVAAAWSCLDLPRDVDAPTLTRKWRRVLPALHPDHGASSAEGLMQAGAAYRLLKTLLPASGRASLQSLQARGARRLVLPPAVELL